MKKAAALRRYLTEHVQDLAENPDRLIVYIPKGRIACSAGSLSFQWAYDLEIVVTDFAGHADDLVVPLLSWLSVNQPEQLQNPATKDNLVRVEAEIIDHDKTDVLLAISVTESVIVSARDDGGWTVHHCSEPTPDDTGGTTPWSMLVNGVELEP